MTLFKVAVKMAAILDILLKIQIYRKMRKLKIRFARVVKYHINKNFPLLVAFYMYLTAKR